MIEAIRTVLRGDRYVSPEITQRLVAHALGTKGESKEPIELLTDRELEFCDQVCSLDDPSYAVIAERMGISVNTVEVHRRNLFKKFGVRTRQSLFRALQRWKVIRGGDRGATMP